MTTDDPVICALAEANPVDPVAPADPALAAEAERILQRVLASPPRRTAVRAVLVPAVSLLVVLGVVVLFLRAGAGTSGGNRTPAARARLTLQAQPASPASVSPGAMAREAAILSQRLKVLGGDFHVTVQGRRILVTSVERVSPVGRARVLALITEPAQLYLYDWEADALTPDGHTVASRLAAQSRAAMQISQGSSGSPGGAGAGSMDLYSAVRLAARQPAAPASRHLSRVGPQYWMFGAPGSVACAAVASTHAPALDTAQHCLLTGPVQGAPDRAVAVRRLAAQLPRTVAEQGQVLTVPQGTVILQAAGQAQSLGSPGAQFFVLRDQAMVNGSEIADPAAGTDSAGEPDVQFTFTAAGRSAFQRVTEQVSHRGQEVSTGGLRLYQHFAVAVDDRLITVPYINFQQYPDGISGSTSAEISGGLTRTTARDLATELRYGALPFPLRVTSG